MLIRKLIFIFTIIASGCATYEPIPSPETEGLREVGGNKVYTIDETLISKNKLKERATKYTTHGLLPGKYTAVYENDMGTFYYGEGRCYFVNYSSVKYYYLREGGFWVPKSDPNHPRIFFIGEEIGNQVIVQNLKDVEQQRSSTDEHALSDPQIFQPKSAEAGLGVGIGMGIVNAIADSEIPDITGDIILVREKTYNDFTDRLSEIINRKE